MGPESRPGWRFAGLFTESPPWPGRPPPRRHRAAADAAVMADFLVVLGIVAFIAAMLGLIRGLERV
jgi:hypothetical protein